MDKYNEYVAVYKNIKFDIHVIHYKYSYEVVLQGKFLKIRAMRRINNFYD